MSLAMKIAVAFAISISAVSVWAQTATPASTNADFLPFQQWMGAVLTGDAATLKSFYSTDPAVKVRVKGVMGDADADTSFWLGLKPRSMTVDVVRNEPRHGHISFIFRSTVVSGSGQSFTLTDDQSWQQEGDQWRLVYIERTDAPALKQPSNMKKDLYPADADAHAEIKEAEEKAAKEHKRLLLVFGANWCFDCHVLDLAFHGPELSPIVDANYQVVHVDLGPDEHKNADLVTQYEIPLNKGIPAIAVVDSDGKLIFSQKNGEVEDARRMTPATLAEFLNKWKPQAQ
jgi:thioredoxin 1